MCKNTKHFIKMKKHFIKMKENTKQFIKTTQTEQETEERGIAVPFDGRAFKHTIHIML
jgi:hypothetical protein